MATCPQPQRGHLLVRGRARVASVDSSHQHASARNVSLAGKAQPDLQPHQRGLPPSSGQFWSYKRGPLHYSNARPTYSNARPTWTNARPTCTNARPTCTNARPTFISEREQRSDPGRARLSQCLSRVRRQGDPTAGSGPSPASLREATSPARARTRERRWLAPLAVGSCSHSPLGRQRSRRR